jgi:hypothetical protein
MVISGRLSKPLKVKQNANYLRQASTKLRQASTKISEKKVKTKKR